LVEATLIADELPKTGENDNQETTVLRIAELTRIAGGQAALATVLRPAAAIGFPLYRSSD